MGASAPAELPRPKPPFTGDARERVDKLTMMDVAAWRAQLRQPALHPFGPSYFDTDSALAGRIVDGLLYGVDIGFKGDRSYSRDARNASSTRDARTSALIGEAIAADVAAGYKAGPFARPPFAVFNVSPLSTVPKGDGIRLIHNLSHPFNGDSINASIDKELYIMQCLRDACAAIARFGRGCLLTKLDISAAFKRVPVRPEDRALLGLRWEDKYYYELVLPFGLRTSGYRWEMYAAALHFFFEKHLGVHLVIHYVDDFLLVAPPGDVAAATAQRSSVEALCARLGAPLEHKKSIGPVTRLEFLGIELDTMAMSMHLSDKRVAALRALLADMGKRDRDCTYTDIVSLVGKLQFAALVIRPGRAFTRRLLQTAYQMRAVRARDGRAEQRRLSSGALDDISWWSELLADGWNKHSLLYEAEWEAAPALGLTTDACDTGYGGRFGRAWFQGRWSPMQLAHAMVEKRISMPYLELHALTQAAVTWGHLWHGKRITFYCDAEASVKAVQKMRSRRDNMAELLRLLHHTAAQGSFDFRCVHIPGVTNHIADALSRGNDVQATRALCPGVLLDDIATPALPLPLLYRGPAARR